MPAFYIALAVLILVALVFVSYKLIAANEPPPAAPPPSPPPQRTHKRRESPQEFVARMIAESEAKDPADWWKRGEQPTDWEP